MTTTEIVEKPEEGNVAALPVRADGGLIEQAAPTSEIVASFNNYQALYDRILIQPTDDRGRPNPNSDFQVIGNKKFPTKSAFRKLATAFVVTSRIISKEWEFEGPAAGRRRKVRFAVVTAEAEAPNGRKAEGIAACDVYEKCIDEGCPSNCERDHGRRGHIRPCPEDCPGTIHFSHPTHDLIATAATRAVNRACSDLFGMGQVSAEEVDRETGEVQGRQQPAQAQQQQQAAPAQPAAEGPPEGWSDVPTAQAAHQLASSRAGKLPENLRGPFRYYRETFGWPMSKAKLDEFNEMLDDAEKQNAARQEHGGYKKGPIAQEPEKKAATMEAMEASVKGAEEMAHDTLPDTAAAREVIESPETRHPDGEATGVEQAVAQAEAQAVADLKAQVLRDIESLNLQTDQQGGLLDFTFGSDGPVSIEELDGGALIDIIDTLGEIREGRVEWGQDGWKEADEGGEQDAEPGPQPGTRRTTEGEPF